MRGYLLIAVLTTLLLVLVEASNQHYKGLDAFDNIEEEGLQDNVEDDEDELDDDDEVEELGQSSLLSLLQLSARQSICDGAAKGSCKKQGGSCVTEPFKDNCLALHGSGGKLKKQACKSKDCQCCAPPPSCSGKIKKSCSKNGGSCVLKPFKANCKGGTLDKKSCKSKHCQCCIGGPTIAPSPASTQVPPVGEELTTLEQTTTPKPIIVTDPTPKPTTPKPVTVYDTTPKPTTLKPVTVYDTTPKPTTPKPVTVYDTTPKPTTPKPVTVYDTTPKPTTPKPVTVYDTTPKPTTPKPVTVYDTTPKPTTFKPTTPNPTTPKPVTVKETTPEPTTTTKPVTVKETTPEPTTTPKPVTVKETTPEPTTTPKPVTVKDTTPEPTTTPKPVTRPPVLAPCPSPFKLRGEECFYVHEDKSEALNWDESRQRCLSMGADLAQPEDALDFLEHIKANHPNAISTIWLGATDREVEQEWKWVSGEPVSTAMWKPYDNQPSGDGNCMEIHYFTSTGFFINDWYCHNKGHFACEFDRAQQAQKTLAKYTAPQDTIWGDSQCSNAGNFEGKSLVECLTQCEETPGCTAINYNDGPNPDCVLRACALPIPAPIWNYASYKGYSLITKPCESPFKLRGSECFFVHEDKSEALNWDESRQRCQSMGGDLAQPKDMVDFIEHIKSNHPNAISTIWLGATDREVEQEWKWVSGTSVPTDMWKPWGNQPSGDGNCMEIHYFPQSSFFMNDWYCHNKGHFACEFDMIP